MKIRTITTGIKLRSIHEIDMLAEAAKLNRKLKALLEGNGYEVQTTRVSTNSFEEFTTRMGKREIIEAIKKMEAYCLQNGINFLSIGYAATGKNIDLIAEIIANTSIISVSAKVGSREEGILTDNITRAAETIKKISQSSDDGYGNFRFCAWANCGPGTPFFPVSYHEGEEISFALGLENGDLATKAFSCSANLVEAEKNLKDIFTTQLQPLDNICNHFALESNTLYKGIDTSLAPALDRGGSIALAYKQLGFGRFGSNGTLSISAVITKVLKELQVKKTGYCGLMFPVCEDIGLAEGADRGDYNLTNLLLYSTVCGCGYDTVPLPGDITVKTIEAMILDTATLANRLNKPLAARLFPVPGRKGGEKTSFDSPFLVNCTILEG